MVKNVVVMTVYDRRPLLLMNVFEGLSKNDLSDTAIIVIDDGSPVNYERLRRDYSNMPIHWHTRKTQRDRKGCYTIGDGYNNSAYVMNCALEEAEKLGAENMFIVCSDVIIPQHALKAAESSIDKAVVIAQTIDMGTGTTFCGPRRIWPMMWFCASKVEYVRRCGGWDEEYLKGQAFEDNDFIGRLFMEVGHLVVTADICCFHQSHEQTAYSDDNKGFKINEKYTYDKWKGVPFRPNDKSLTFEKRSIRPGLAHLFDPQGLYRRKPMPENVPVIKIAQTAEQAYTCEDDDKKRVSVTEADLRILQDLFSGQRVLEIGTGLGISTRAIASKALSIVTVDNDPWVKENVVPALLAEHDNLDFRNTIPGEGWLGRPLLNAVFIDLDDPADVERVINLCKPLVDDGALFVVHDTRKESAMKAFTACGLEIETSFSTGPGMTFSHYRRPKLAVAVEG